MFKNSPSICYIFFAIDDIIVTSVNIHTSMMGISTEDKYTMKSLQENNKYGAKRLLKMFPNKKSNLGRLKVLIKKLTTQVLYCADSARSTTTQYVDQQYLRCQFFEQCFQFTKTPVFVRKHFKQSLCSIFLIFSQRFDQALIWSKIWSVLIPIINVLTWRHNYVINSKEYVTDRWTIFKHL